MGISAGVLAGGYMASQGAQSAAETQAAAGQQAIATQQQMLASQQAIQKPYAAAGEQALQALLAGTQPGGQFTQQFAMGQLPQYQAPSTGLQTFQPSGAALPEFKPFQPESSEAVKFASEAALDAMRNQMAVGGQALSSNAISGAGQLAGDIASQYEQQGYNQWLASQNQQFGQALAGRQLTAAEQAQQFTQGMAGQQLSAAQQAQQYQQALTSQQQAQNVYQMNLQNQLAPLQYLTGIGQAAASGQSANLGAVGQNIAGLQQGIGNVLGAGQAASATAQSNAIGNISQYMMLQSLLGKK